MGVNRISFGFQSASDNELRALGCIHTAADLAASFNAARAAGFKNISVDLMYGIPNQTEQSFANTLDFVRSLAPEHISVYGLKIEGGTRFFEERDRLSLPDEETEYKMYRTAHTVLENAGYKRYWKDEKYLGFGVSAHSYFSGQRYAYIDDIEKYMLEMEHPKDMSRILSECTDIDVYTKESEYVMLRMRLFEGVNLGEYRQTFDRDFVKKYGEKLERYIKGGFVKLDNVRCAFTVKGMYVSNYILSEILDF